MENPKPKRLILASGSPARKDLLSRIGWPFDVVPPNVEEPDGTGVSDPRKYVHEVAWMKAAAIAPKVADGIIIAADTVGWIDSQIIGKPADENAARRILSTLGGREHELWTGVVLWHQPRQFQLCWQECSRVFFKRLSPEEMTSYLATRQWLGCSGAYAIQENNDPFAQLLSGNLSNVIGLPLESLKIGLEWMAKMT
jgi:septum formation protein